MSRSGVPSLAVLSFTASLLLVGSQDGSQPPPHRGETPSLPSPAGSTLAPIDLVYVCGNTFVVTNGTPSVVQVTYRVAGTDETGGLTLPEGPGGDPGHSETEFQTTQSGVVELYLDDVRIARRPNEGLSCGAPAISASVASAGNEATAGKWTTPFSWPIIGVHVHLLRNGKVLSWGKFGSPYVWHPSSGAFTVVAAGSWIFCSGHT